MLAGSTGEAGEDRKYSLAVYPGRAEDGQDWFYIHATNELDGSMVSSGEIKFAPVDRMATAPATNSLGEEEGKVGSSSLFGEQFVTKYGLEECKYASTLQFNSK